MRRDLLAVGQLRARLSWHVRGHGGGGWPGAGSSRGSRVSPTVIGGLDHPWDIAFTPGGNMVFTERSGRINILFGGQRRVLAAPPTSGRWARAACSASPSTRTSRPTDGSTPASCRTPRERSMCGSSAGRSTTRSPASSNRADIVTGIPVNTAGQTGRHSGCRPRFGPDGYLWIGTGDSATGTVPQDPNSLGGKVLRIDTNGAGAPGNPGGAVPARRSTTTGTATCRASPSVGGGKAYSHRARHRTATTRSTACSPAATTAGTPSRRAADPGYDESPADDRPGEVPERHQRRVELRLPDHRPVRRHVPARLAVVGLGQHAGGGRAQGPAAPGVRLRRAAGRRSSSSGSGSPNRGRLRVAVQGPNGDLYLATDASPGQIFRVHPKASAGSQKRRSRTSRTRWSGPCSGPGWPVRGWAGCSR